MQKLTFPPASLSLSLSFPSYSLLLLALHLHNRGAAADFAGWVNFNSNQAFFRRRTAFQKLLTKPFVVLVAVVLLFFFLRVQSLSYRVGVGRRRCRLASK